MKKITLLLLCMPLFVSLHAQDDDEFYTFHQDLLIDTCINLNVMREIKGGTKIIVTFTGNWDEDMKGAFRYACKIWEENLPTMLPITISANIGTFRASNSNSISKVLVNRLSNVYPGLAPQAKYVLLAEYNQRHNVQFTSLQDSIDLNNPDITITYNINKLNTDELSFSIDSTATTKIDFVTQVLRDIAVGLGFCTHFDPQNSQLELPDDMEYSGLEKCVKEAITTYNWYYAYNQATQGSLAIRPYGYGQQQLYLYAPSTWVQKLSLNSFIPQQNSGLSQLMTWNFGRGTILRNITDLYKEIFDNGFQWYALLPVGAQSDIISYYSCSNNSSISYHGTLSMTNPNSRNMHSWPDTAENGYRMPANRINTRDEGETFNYSNYCKPFDPTLGPNNNVNHEGWTLAILKNDGTWDVVAEEGNTYSDFQVNLANITLHSSDEEYARTTDKYLRARVSFNVREWDFLYGRAYNNCRSSYFVLNYLPQKIEQNLAVEYDDSYLQEWYLRDIDIAMSNLEGATQVFVEQLEEGDTYPSISLISDFKKGRFLATVDKEYESEFTLVAYNSDGFKRSDALVVEPLEPAELRLSVDNDHISVTYGHKNKQVSECTYEITSLSKNAVSRPIKVEKKCLNGMIPLSELNAGLSIVKVTHPNGKSASIKVLGKKPLKEVIQ